MTGSGLGADWIRHRRIASVRRQQSLTCRGAASFGLRDDSLCLGLGLDLLTQWPILGGRGAALGRPGWLMRGGHVGHYLCATKSLGGRLAWIVNRPVCGRGGAVGARDIQRAAGDLDFL